MSVDEMVGRHNQWNKHELGQTLGDGEAWSAAVHGGPKESDTVGQLNNNNACFNFITLIFRKFG